MIGFAAISGNGAGSEQPSVHDVRKRHPKFIEALLADARVAGAFRGERFSFDSKLDGVLQALRLMVVTDAFLALAAYRAKARLQSLGVPLLPHLFQHIAIMAGHISIGDPVLVQPGVHISHGYVVIDGFTEVESGAILAPWVTIGLIGTSMVGPTIGPHARIGTGAKVLGQIELGAGSRVAANSVVLSDVPDGSTVVGNPAKTVAD